MCAIVVCEVAAPSCKSLPHIRETAAVLRIGSLNAKDLLPIRRCNATLRAANPFVCRTYQKMHP
jgi:hypothetical protein